MNAGLPFLADGAEARSYLAGIADDVTDFDAYAYRSRLIVRMLAEPNRSKRAVMMQEINDLADEVRDPAPAGSRRPIR